MGTAASLPPNIRIIIAISFSAGMVLIIGLAVGCHYWLKRRRERKARRALEEGAGVNREMDRMEMKSRVFGRPEWEGAAGGGWEG
jgi:hypothetical protein